MFEIKKNVYILMLIVRLLFGYGRFFFFMYVGIIIRKKEGNILKECKYICRVVICSEYNLKYI